MVQVATKQVSFAAGEISPTLHARDDLARYQIGLKACENFVVLLEGGITRAPGTRFVLPLKNENEAGALVPFRVSGAVGDSYMLVFNGGAMRVLYRGGVVPSFENPFELAVPWAAVDLENLRYGSDGNDIYLFCRGYAPRKVTRVDHADWTIGYYHPVGGPVSIQNVDQAKTIRANAVSGTTELTASAPLFGAGDVGAVWRLDEPDLTAVPLWIGNENVNTGDRRRNGGRVYESLSANGTSSGPNPPVHDEGDASSGSGKVVWRYLHAGHGYVRITAVVSPLTATGTVELRLPDSVVSGPTYRWWSPAWSDLKGWPDIVRLNDGRLLAIRDAEFWLSTANDVNSMEETALDDSAISSRLTSPDGAAIDIMWAVLTGVLVIGTRDGEWIVRAPNVSDALTVAGMRVLPDENQGSSPHIPAIVEGGAIFIGRSRRRLHYCKFDRLTEKLDIEEITVSARHILRGGAVKLAFQADPHKLLWIVCDDGALVSVTFMPKQQVLGFARHPRVNAKFEAVAAIPSSDAAVSETYFIVRRTIDGVTRRYVEQLTDFFEPADPTAPTAAGAWFVDCGLARTFETAVTTISGLDHLEGQEVAVFADGGEQSRKIVAGGAITLDHESASVLVGLPLTARARMLPQNVNLPQGSSKGRAKRANHLIVDVTESAGAEISCNGGPPELLQETGALDYGAPVPLQSGSLRCVLEAAYADEVEIEIVCDNALPLTLLGATPDLDLAEG